MTSLYLIRHGRTTWNKLKRYCGRLDVPLSQEGRRQAVQLRDQLKTTCFDRIYSSPQKRALQTLAIVFKRAKFTKVGAFREIDFGDIEGMYYKDILEKYGPLYAGWMRNPYKYRLPHSESAVSFKKRIALAINKIVKHNQGKTIAVVCHGAVIGMYISILKNKKSFWRYVPKAASITVVEFRKSKPRLTCFNNTEHLDGQKTNCALFMERR